MDGFEFFRRFLGLPRDGRDNNFKYPPWDEYDYDEWDELDDLELPPGSGWNNSPGFSFRVFSGDPFDLHRDFQKQMDEVMRNFMGLMSPNHDFPALPGGPFLDGGSLEPSERPEAKAGEVHPRNRYLKPSYDKVRPPGSFNRADSDVDGRFTGSEIDAILGEPSYEPAVSQAPKTRIFGQSSISKTIRGPDGRVEHHKTFKASDGTEHTVVTRQIGDQSHSVTVKKNKDGTTEQLEDFINMSENDLNQFNQLWNNRTERGHFPVPALASPPSAREDSKSWADKFLKWFK